MRSLRLMSRINKSNGQHMIVHMKKKKKKKQGVGSSMTTSYRYASSFPRFAQILWNTRASYSPTPFSCMLPSVLILYFLFCFGFLLIIFVSTSVKNIYEIMKFAYFIFYWKRKKLISSSALLPITFFNKFVRRN